MVPSVGFHEADHHVGPPLGAPVRFTEHGVGLAHPGRATEIDAELATAFLAHYFLVNVVVVCAYQCSYPSRMAACQRRGQRRAKAGTGSRCRVRSADGGAWRG